MGEGALARLYRFMGTAFPGALLQERRGEHTRWQVPNRGALGSVFEAIEGSKAELGVVEYAVSQTTLEQIFVQFASQQEEEVGKVRGMAADASGQRAL